MAVGILEAPPEIFLSLVRPAGFLESRAHGDDRPKREGSAQRPGTATQGPCLPGCLDRSPGTGGFQRDASSGSALALASGYLHMRIHIPCWGAAT